MVSSLKTRLGTAEKPKRLVSRQGRESAPEWPVRALGKRSATPPVFYQLVVVTLVYMQVTVFGWVIVWRLMFSAFEMLVTTTFW